MQPLLLPCSEKKMKWNAMIPKESNMLIMHTKWSWSPKWNGLNSKSNLLCHRSISITVIILGIKINSQVNFNLWTCRIHPNLQITIPANPLISSPNTIIKNNMQLLIDQKNRINNKYYSPLHTFLPIHTVAILVSKDTAVHIANHTQTKF